MLGSLELMAWTPLICTRHQLYKRGSVKRPLVTGRSVQVNITTIGFDLAKNVFQLHGIDVRGNVRLRK